MLEVRLDTQDTLTRLRRQLDAMPAGVERAQKRALRKLSSWTNRTLLREAASAAGATQKVIKGLRRYRATLASDGQSLVIWFGTNPIKAHHLGKVTWTPRMRGARVGRRTFPGDWSWGEGSKTGKAVMRRIGAYGRNGNPRLERIDVVTVPIDDQVRERITALQPSIEARYAELLRQELNYAINVEARRA